MSSASSPRDIQNHELTSQQGHLSTLLFLVIHGQAFERGLFTIYNQLMSAPPPPLSTIQQNLGVFSTELQANLSKQVNFPMHWLLSS